jgi:4-hydroxy-tetrahydrodipicolinate synthase
MNYDEKKFVPVMITPFDQRNEIDRDCLARIIDFYLEAGVKGLFANCLSSEMFSLTCDERIELTRQVVDQVKNRVPVVSSGSFGADIDEKSSFTKKIFETGADAVIMITSHFASEIEGDNMLLQNFEKMFQLTGKIPLGLYECPAPYKRVLSAEVFKTLLSSDRLIYHKDTSLCVDQIEKKLEVLQALENKKLEFYDAHSPNAIQSLKLGATGMSAISGNFYPEVMVWLCNHVSDPEKKSAVEWIQSEISRADPIIHQGYPLSAKYFLKKRGLPIRLVSRVQVSNLTSEQKKALDDLYVDFISWCERLNITPVI